MPAVVGSLDMHDAMDGGAYLCIGLSREQGRSTAHEQGAQSEQRAFGAARVDGSQCSPVSAIHRVQQSAGLSPTYLTQNDPVRVMTQVRAEHIVKGDRFPVRISLGLLCNHMRFADMQLRSILDDEDAFFFRIESAKTLSKVVLPVPVPPEISMLSPRRTALARTSACSSVSILRSIKSFIVKFLDVNRRTVTNG